MKSENIPHAAFEKVGTFQLPLALINGVKEFNIDYFEFQDGRYSVLWIGDLVSSSAPMVRMQSYCVWGALGSRQCDCAWQLEESKKRIACAGAGLIIIAHDEIGKGIGLRHHSFINSEAARLGISDVLVDAYSTLGFEIDYRTHANQIIILKSYGLLNIQLLTNSPSKMETLRQAGFKIDRIPLEMPLDVYNEVELTNKAKKVGHLLTLDNNDNR